MQNTQFKRITNLTLIIKRWVRLHVNVHILQWQHRHFRNTSLKLFSVTFHCHCSGEPIMARMYSYNDSQFPPHREKIFILHQNCTTYLDVGMRSPPFRSLLESAVVAKHTKSATYPCIFSCSIQPWPSTQMALHNLLHSVERGVQNLLLALESQPFVAVALHDDDNMWHISWPISEPSPGCQQSNIIIEV
jgi:hypothetical protein